MPIQFFCPSGHRLNAPESQQGKLIRCPACRQAAVVPTVTVGELAEKIAGEALGPPPRPAPAENPPPPAPADASMSKEVAPADPPDSLGPTNDERPAGPPPLPAGPVATERAPDTGRQAASGTQPVIPGLTEHARGAPALEASPPEPPPRDSNGDGGPPPEPPSARGRRHGRRQPPPAPSPSTQRDPPSRRPRQREAVARRVRPQRGPRLIGPDVAPPEPARVEATRWLALFLGLIALFSVGPAAMHLNLASAPGWARAVLLLAALEAAYVVWMLAAPDWSTAWVLMLVFAAGAALTAAATAATLATPLDQPMPWGLGAIRRWAPAWFAAVTAVQGLGAYLAGRLSHRWHRAARAVRLRL